MNRTRCYINENIEMDLMKHGINIIHFCVSRSWNPRGACSLTDLGPRICMTRRSGLSSAYCLCKRQHPAGWQHTWGTIGTCIMTNSCVRGTMEQQPEIHGEQHSDGYKAGMCTCFDDGRALAASVRRFVNHTQQQCPVGSSNRKDLREGFLVVMLSAEVVDGASFSGLGKLVPHRPSTCQSR